MENVSQLSINNVLIGVLFQFVTIFSSYSQAIQVNDELS